MPRRILAILAGGVVLGTGAAVSLAAWNDSEYATATITAGRFGIEGSLDGTTYSEHSSSPGATLAFSPVVSAMVPGAVSYGSFSVRTIAGSAAGAVQLQTPAIGGTGLAPSLTYAVRAIPVATACDASVFATSAGSSVVAAGTALNAAITAPQTTLAANSATPVKYCFQLTFPSTVTDNSLQGKTATATWQFLGTST